MKITAYNKFTKWTKSELKEWSIADKEHYGHAVDWKKKYFTIKAYDDNTTVGTLRIELTAGVVYVIAIIISSRHRKKGIGKMLMQKAEEIAIENGAHKIYLDTVKDWEAFKFYKTLGYKITSDLPNHYFHLDFIEMTKFI